MTHPTNRFSKYVTAILAFLAFNVSTNVVMSQNNSIEDHWYIGPKISMVSYFGDLSVHDFNPIKKVSDESDFSWGGLIGKSVNRFVDLRASYNQGNMRGSNPGLDMYFKTIFNEINLEATIDLSRLSKPSKSNRFNLLATAGIGYLHFRSIKNRISDGSYLSSEGYTTQGKPSGKAGSSLIIPIGLELNYQPAKKWTVMLGFSFRLHSQDLLDSHIGSTGISDRYSMTSLGISYILNPVSKNSRQKVSGVPDNY